MKTTKSTIARLLAFILLCCMLLPMMTACESKKSEIVIGENGNWFIDGEDTGVSATGKDGKDGTKVTIGENGNWFLDGKDSGVKAAGKDGTNGSQITIGENGNWFIDGVDSGKTAVGKDGSKVSIGANGNWYIDGKDTGVSATGNGASTDDFQPIIRFAVASDVHMREGQNDLQSMENLQKLFKTAYGYSTSQPYNKLDGMFIVGDYTQNGSIAELDKFWGYVNANVKNETTFRVVLGNHEFWSTGRYTDESVAETYNRYLSYGNYETVDQHVKIGDYHFLILNMDLYNDNSADRKYSPEKLTWLDGELAKAAADDPTGTKPIFIFNHMPAINTVNNSTKSASDSYLGEVLSKYPQAVDFSGHTHRTLTDPKSIWQGDYTAISTGSLAYITSVIAGHSQYDKSGVIALNNEGNWASGDIETAVRNGCLYYLVEVNAEHEVRLVVNNIFTEQVEFIIDLGKLGDPSTYTFNDTRKYQADTPAFPTGATLQAGTATRSTISVIIPQATGEVAVNNYRVEAYRGMQKVATTYSLACAYLGSAAADTVKATLTNLSSDTTYTIKVYPVNYWGKEGTPLEIDVATASSQVSLVPNLFSAKFNDDSSAVDTVGDINLRAVGNANVIKDSTLNKNVAVLDGKGCYIYDNMSGLYPSLSDGFSIEIECYINEIPASDYFNIVSNQEGGGFGFELKATGEMQFILHTGSAYERTGVSIKSETKKWIHLVATYDPSTKQLAIYKDGQKAGSITTSGSSLGLPSLQYLCIGGDSGSGMNGALYMSGMVGAVNIYNDAFTAEEVKTIYNNTKS